jgi:hypothetical protein
MSRVIARPRTALAAFTALWLGVAAAGGGASAAEPTVDDLIAAASAPSTAERLATWIVSSGDNAGLPFAIVDKLGARVSVYGKRGRLVGAAPALTGLQPGDDSAPDIGKRAMSKIRPEERTTPAGRFIASLGPAKGEGQVLWIDYGAAISMHPVVTTNPKEHRRKRLRSAAPEDHRISYGCVNVPARFYTNVVARTFKGTRGVVYVLPDTRPVEEVFPAFGLQAREAALPIAAETRAADTAVSDDADTGTSKRRGAASASLR